ncbi:unnamed protein product, partial [Trichobilharzia szidati]
MSLTCNIRNLAGQVKNRLVGERKRSLSSNDSNNNDNNSEEEIINQMNSRQESSNPCEQRDQQHHRSKTVTTIITTPQTPTSTPMMKTTATSPRQHGGTTHRRQSSSPNNSSDKKRFQKQQQQQQLQLEQQFQTTRSTCQCHGNCINSSQPNCSSSTSNNSNNNSRIENSNQLTPHLSPSCTHNSTLCSSKTCKQSSGSSFVPSPILQEQTRNYSVDGKDSHICNQHQHHRQYPHHPHHHHQHPHRHQHHPNAQQHQSRQHVCLSNNDEQSRNHMNRNEFPREDKTSSASFCCDKSQLFNQNPGIISEIIDNTTNNSTTVSKSNTSNQNIFQAINYSLLNNKNNPPQLYGSTLLIPTVPDLSTGQNEIRSGSLGSAYPLHCAPYHFGQNRYGLFHGADYHYKQRQQHLQQRYHHHHQHQRHDHDQHHDPLRDQYQHHHNSNSNNNTNPRLTMSYSELLNSMIPQHCHSQLSTHNNTNDDVSNSSMSNNHKPDSFEGVTNLSKPKTGNSSNSEAPNTTIQHLCVDNCNNDCHISIKDNNNKDKQLSQSPKLLINNSEIINNQIEDYHSTCSPQNQSISQHNSNLDINPPVLPTRTSSLIMHQKLYHMNKTDLKRNITLSSCMIPGPSSSSSSLLPLHNKVDFMQQSMIDYPYNYDITTSSSQSQQFINPTESQQHSRSHSTLSTRRGGFKSYENTSQPATMTSSTETVSNHEVMTTSFLQQQQQQQPSPNLSNKNINSNNNNNVDDDVNSRSIDEEFERSFPGTLNDSFNDESSPCQDKSSLDDKNSKFLIPDPIPISPSCGALEQFMPMNHASRLLGRMSDKLRDGRLADVILLAGIKSTSTSTSLMNTKCANLISDHNYSSTTKMDLSSLPDELIVRIPAHRVILAAASDYFAAMFSNELKEATEQEIWIHEVDPYALKALINYIYTGHLDLREETVGDLLAAACFLQITEASQACERFLTKRLDATNCLSMSRLSEQYGCHLLRKRSTKFVLEHFSDVSQQPDFLNLTFKELVTLVSSDRLRVSNEATVFAACLRWTRNAMVQENKPTTKSDGNESLLASLLRHVRLTQVPPRLLIDALEKEALFQEDLMAIRLIISALRVHFSSDSLHLQTHKTQRRTNMECCLKYNTVTNNSTHIVKTNTADNNNSNNISGVMNRLPDTKASSLSSFSSLSTASIDESNSISTSPQQQQQQQTERVGINNQDPSHNLYHHQGHSADQPYQSPQFNNCRKSHNQVSDSHKCDAYMMNKPRPSTIGRLWALGGKTMTTTRALQEILEYDPYWNTWRTIGQLPGQRQQCGCIILTDGRLLVVGGRDELKTLSTVECINIEEMSQMYEFNSEYQKKLSNKSPLEAATSKQGVSRSSARQHSTDRNDIRSNENQQDLSTELNSNSATALCPTTTSYRSEQQTQNMPSNSTTMNSKEIQSKGEEYSSWKIVSAMATHRLYAVGGRDGSACLRTVERFNPHTQHWCFIAPMLHRRGGVGVGAVGGRLYAVGGHNAPPNQPHALRTASVEMYEPHTDMWTEVSALSS